jgi:hypothetical protein
MNTAAKETPERHKTVSIERVQHTEIPFPRDKEPLRFGPTRTKFARDSVRCAARGNMVSTLRGKATNIDSRNQYPALNVRRDINTEDLFVGRRSWCNMGGSNKKSKQKCAAFSISDRVSTSNAWRICHDDLLFPNKMQQSSIVG